MAALPPNKNSQNKPNTNTNNNNNNKNQQQSQSGFSLFNSDIDAASFAQRGGAFKGALASQPQSMGFQDSYADMPGGSAVGSIMHVWGPKQIHQKRSIPTRESQSGMGSKGGSYTLEAAPPAKDGMKMSMIPASKVSGGFGNVDSMKHSLLAAQNHDIVVKQDILTNPNENTNKMKIKQQDKLTNDSSNNNDNNDNDNEMNINSKQTQKQKQKQDEFKENEMEAKSSVGYRDPTDHFANDVDATPLLFNADYCALDCPGSSLSADGLKKDVVSMLNELVQCSYVDWDYEDRYTIQGRIYKMNEDAGYRITIYLLENDDTEYQCILEVRRNGGDSFLFQEFKSKFLGLMSDNNSIDYEKGPEFTMEHGFLASDFCELPPLDDNDLLSETNDDWSFLTPLSSMSNMTTLSNESQIKFDADSCVQEAIDVKQYRELYRESVAYLRNAANDETKLNEIANVENVIDKLLTPIYGNRQIFDTLVIKSLLEVIYEIVSQNANLASADNRQTIRDINQQWDKMIPHPISNSIEGFFPSQQIQWISRKCIETFSD